MVRSPTSTILSLAAILVLAACGDSTQGEQDATSDVPTTCATDLFEPNNDSMTAHRTMVGSTLEASLCADSDPSGNADRSDFYVVTLDERDDLYVRVQPTVVQASVTTEITDAEGRTLNQGTDSVDVTDVTAGDFYIEVAIRGDIPTPYRLVLQSFR